MDHIDHIRDELRQPALDLRELIPRVYHGYVELSSAAMSAGELDAATKELIALAVSATRECDGCIASHARGAHRAGATRQQVAEAMGVVIALNGGPGTVWGPRALRSFDEAAAGREPSA